MSGRSVSPTGIPGLGTPASRAGRTVAVAAAATALGGLAWVAGDGLDAAGRARLVRYVGILTAAALGIAAPHVLFPDPHVRLLQLANVAPRALLARSLSRWLPLLGVLSVPPTVLALGADVEWTVRLGLAVEGVVATFGVGLYAFARYAPLGERILAWETGEGGRVYHSVGRVAPPVRFQVPDSLVPGLLVTGEVFLVGSAVAIAGQASHLSGWGILPALLLLATASVLTLRLADCFDRHFYGTGGLWADAFGTSAGRTEEREPLGYTAVYWAPERFRPAVWAGLVSLDRRLPLGRAVAAGLLFVAALDLAGAPSGVWTAVLALLVLALNASLALTASDAVLPFALARRVHGAGAWAGVRFLMAVRWLPPLVAVLLALAWLSPRVAWTDAAGWGGAYVAVAALAAVTVTVLSELRARRALA